MAAALLALLPSQEVPAPREQERECSLVKVGGYTVSRRQDSVNYTHRASGGIDYRCTDGTRILADSAVVWGRSGNVFLVKRVHFEDADTELDADSARYFGNVRELRAWSRVTLTDRRSGAVLMGDSLFYQRESRWRTMDRIHVRGGSPRAVVHPATRPAAPVAVPGPVEADPARDAPGPGADVPEPDSLAEEPSEESSVDGLAERPRREPPADSLAEESDGMSREAGPADAPPGVAGNMGGAEASAPADSVAPTPYEVEAPRLYIDGRRFFRAGGGVVVTRDSLRTFGDSLDYDQEVGEMLIFGNAHVVDRGFELTGASVSVTPAAGRDEEIVAREDAELAGDQVLMRAPAIRLFLEEGQVTRIVALPSVAPLPGPGDEELVDTAGLTPGDVARARSLAEAARRAAEREGELEGDSAVVPDSLPRPAVTAADFRLTGDSIEVLSPNRLLDVVTAVGGARAEAMNADSVPGEDLPEIAASDWIEGRTIVARFVPGGPPEDGAATGGGANARRARLESLTATEDARSLYRVFDTAQAEPGTVRAETDTAETDTAETDAGPGEPDADATAAAPAEPEMTETDASPRDEGARPPALHYVRGNQITIHVEGRKVVRMEVKGETTGFHFEPLPPDSLADTADSAAVPDTAGAGADTANPAADTANPAADTANPAADTANPVPDTANPAADTVNPAVDSVNPAADTANPAADSAGASGPTVAAPAADTIRTPPYQPVDKISPAFERRRIRAGRFASPV
ncbi:MAG: hypothetical protein OXU64_04805, partial [Gemmatimonadota bacterium]|nr:hypothetical protein [Gemmatimonadota bacterium]